jgi:carboxyl-terminal processing protease
VVPLAFVLGVGFGVAMPIQRAVADKKDDAPHATLEQLAKVMVLIENRYVDPVDRERLINGALRGMVSELDPHSEYFPPREFDDFNADTEGKFGGIGVEVDGRGEYLTVIAPIEGGPAERAGILPGDEIVAIDGQDARNIGLDKSVKVMRGEPGTKIELTIRRPSEMKIFRVPLIRREIRLPSIDFAALPDGVAWIRIRQFQERTHDDFVDAIGKVRAEIGGPIRGVVLDLRRNPGGLVDQAMGIADEVLDGGVVYRMKGQGGRVLEEGRAKSGGALVSPPMVALIDGGSASASELLAAALADHKRATLVGETTFGKGSVQSILQLGGGAGVKLTIARYYSPNGRSIQGQGVEPDVVVEAHPGVAGDPRWAFPKERDLPHALPPELSGAAKTPAPPLLPAPSASAASSAATVASAKAEAIEAALAQRKPDPSKDAQLRVALELLAKKRVAK